MAQRFEFSLQTLLRIRQQEEKLAIAELGRLQAEKNKILAHAGRLEQSLEKEYAVHQKSSDPARSFQIVQRIAQLQDMITREKKRVAPDLAEMEKKISDQRQVLMQKSTDKRVVEKLKEKAYEEYLIEQRREENKENDDMNQNIYQYKQRLHGVS